MLIHRLHLIQLKGEHVHFAVGLKPLFSKTIRSAGDHLCLESFFKLRTAQDEINLASKVVEGGRGEEGGTLGGSEHTHSERREKEMGEHREGRKEGRENTTSERTFEGEEVCHERERDVPNSSTLLPAQQECHRVRSFLSTRQSE